MAADPAGGGRVSRSVAPGELPMAKPSDTTGITIGDWPHPRYDKLPVLEIEPA